MLQCTQRRMKMDSSIYPGGYKPVFCSDDTIKYCQGCLKTMNAQRKSGKPYDINKLENCLGPIPLSVPKKESDAHKKSRREHPSRVKDEKESKPTELSLTESIVDLLTKNSTMLFTVLLIVISFWFALNLLRQRRR